MTATTTDSLTVKLKPHDMDSAPIHGYTLHYKPEFGDWETVEVAVDAQKYTIESLFCGSRYQVYATGYNRCAISHLFVSILNENHLSNNSNIFDIVLFL